MLGIARILWKIDVTFGYIPIGYYKEYWKVSMLANSNILSLGLSLFSHNVLSHLAYVGKNYEVGLFIGLDATW